MSSVISKIISRKKNVKQKCFHFNESKFSCEMFDHLRAQVGAKLPVALLPTQFVKIRVGESQRLLIPRDIKLSTKIKRKKMLFFTTSRPRIIARVVYNQN